MPGPRSKVSAMEKNAMLLAIILTLHRLLKDAMHMSMVKPAIPRRAEIPMTTTDLSPNSHYLFLLSRMMSPRFLFHPLKYPAFLEVGPLGGIRLGADGGC